MNIRHISRKIPVNVPLVSIVVLFVGNILYFTIIRPTSAWLVLLGIVLLSALTHVLLAQTKYKRFASVITVFVAVFLLMNYIAGFSVINTLLLASIIIVARKLTTKN